MTFTVIARDPQNKDLGVCQATSPLAVASRCPYVVGGVAAVSSQCHTNPNLRVLVMDLLRNDLSPDRVLEHLRFHDEWFEWRQVGIVTADGRVAVHSPQHGKSFTGHIVGDDFICMGNGLAGREVVEAMADKYENSTATLFEERLLQALEAGGEAGGEPIGQASADLVVATNGARMPRTDLRVDMANPLPRDGGNAIADLRRVFTQYAPLIDYYTDFWPANPEVDWREILKEKGIEPAN